MFSCHMIFSYFQKIAPSSDLKCRADDFRNKRKRLKINDQVYAIWYKFQKYR